MYQPACSGSIDAFTFGGDITSAVGEMVCNVPVDLIIMSIKWLEWSNGALLKAEIPKNCLNAWYCGCGWAIKM